MFLELMPGVSIPVYYSNGHGEETKQRHTYLSFKTAALRDACPMNPYTAFMDTYEKARQRIYRLKYKYKNAPEKPQAYISAVSDIELLCTVFAGVRKNCCAPQSHSNCIFMLPAHESVREATTIMQTVIRDYDELNLGVMGLFTPLGVEREEWFAAWNKFIANVDKCVFMGDATTLLEPMSPRKFVDYWLSEHDSSKDDSRFSAELERTVKKYNTGNRDILPQPPTNIITDHCVTDDVMPAKRKFHNVKAWGTLHYIIEFEDIDSASLNSILQMLPAHIGSICKDSVHVTADGALAIDMTINDMIDGYPAKDSLCIERLKLQAEDVDKLHVAVRSIADVIHKTVEELTC